MTHHAAHHEKNALAVVIIIVALAVGYIFFQNQDFLLDSNDIPRYVTLAAVALGLLIVLFFMVSGRVDRHMASHNSTSKKSSKKKKK